MMTYTTGGGDMWDKIAHDTLGDEKYTDLLIAENPDYHDVYIFPADVELTIPDVETRTVADDLPPWKRVNG